jgi:hypothetical protein
MAAPAGGMALPAVIRRFVDPWRAKVHVSLGETAFAIWQADHSPLDILLLDENGKATKPWLTVIEDDHSRAVASFRLTFAEPTTLTTTLALRQAIWRKEDPRWQICGIPSVFYTDHGSDFTSKHMEQGRHAQHESTLVGICSFRSFLRSCLRWLDAAISMTSFSISHSQPMEDLLSGMSCPAEPSTTPPR